VVLKSAASFSSSDSPAVATLHQANFQPRQGSNKQVASRKLVNNSNVLVLVIKISMFNRNNVPNPFGGARQEPSRGGRTPYNEEQYSSSGGPPPPPPQYDNDYYNDRSQRGPPPSQHHSSGQRRGPDQYGVASDYPQQRSPGRPQRGHEVSIRETARPATLKPVKSPSDQFTLRNLAAVSTRDFPPNRDGQDHYLLVNDRFVFTAKPYDGCQPGTIGLSDAQRTWAGVSITEDMVVATIYDPFTQSKQAYLSSLDLDVGFAGKKISNEKYSQDELEDAFKKLFSNQILTPGQRIIMDIRNIKLLLIVKSIQLTDLSMQKKADADVPYLSDPLSRGILTSQTLITFYKNANSAMQLGGSTKRAAANTILTPDFKFEDMGIGGLDVEFSAIFRRAFASRIFPVGLVEKLGIQHVKGMLLYGPPGTGKTLIARQIGKMLNTREPKVVNGPEILNAYVGKSEENVRKLFEEAEKEYKEKGDESALHIIIFDELDAVCKQRGTGNSGGTGVGDSVVNQLLAKVSRVCRMLLA
jgi:vesicle-fusing ATPase